ncbi:MAG TPA: hypothetical protein VL175_18235 [Pirellulales bacterium]|jgi:hypothetical protein|nr:hypothetical protein [Pirellulales bacterium]
MSTNHKPLPDEVEHLLRNAQLRDELEPYFDESIRSVNVEELPTPVENEFLASMLAWERAPILPISQWFEPELKLPHPDTLDEFQLHERLWETIHRMFGRRIVLEFTDHLNDRELYCLIYRDILPCSEKKIDSATNYLHWDCADVGGDPTTWLRYYATPEERRAWAEDLDEPLPEREVAPYPRQLPRRPL